MTLESSLALARGVCQIQQINEFCNPVGAMFRQAQQPSPRGCPGLFQAQNETALRGCPNAPTPHQPKKLKEILQSINKRVVMRSQYGKIFSDVLVCF